MNPWDINLWGILGSKIFIIYPQGIPASKINLLTPAEFQSDYISILEEFQSDYVCTPEEFQLD